MNARQDEKGASKRLQTEKKIKLLKQVNHLKWIKQQQEGLKQNDTISQDKQKIVEQTPKRFNKSVHESESTLKIEKTELLQQTKSSQEKSTMKRPFNKLILSDQLQNQLLEIQKQSQKKKKFNSPEKCNDSTCIEISSSSQEQLAKKFKISTQPKSKTLQKTQDRTSEQIHTLNQDSLQQDNTINVLFSRVKVTYVHLNSELISQLRKQKKKFDKTESDTKALDLKINLQSKFVNVARTAPICMIIEKIKSQERIFSDIKSHKFFMFKGSLSNLQQKISNSFSNYQTSIKSQKLINLQRLYDWYTLAHLLSWSSNIVIVVEKNVMHPFIEDMYNFRCHCKNICWQFCLCLQFWICREKQPCSQKTLSMASRHQNICRYSKPCRSIFIKDQMINFDQKRIIGLKNHQNSCFMNTALQCLVACKPLTEYFLENEHLKNINLGNSFGTFGEITKRYSQFLKEYYTTKKQVIHTEKFQKALCRWENKYLLDQQQDSQQFLIRLLDWLKEDLNLNHRRPQYIQTDECQTQSVQIKAQKAWKTQLARNNSIIEYLMAGVLKSEIQCTECSYKSHNFENFLTLPLPVVKSNSRQRWTFRLKVSIVYENFKRKNETTIITLGNFQYKNFINEVKASFGLESSSQLIGIVYQPTTGSLQRITNQIQGRQFIKKCKQNPQKNSFLFLEYKAFQLGSKSIEVRFLVKIRLNQKLISKSCQRYLFFLIKEGSEIKNVFKKLLIYFYSRMFKNREEITLAAYLTKFLNPQNIPFKIYFSNENQQISIEDNLSLKDKAQIDVVFENEELFNPNQLTASIFIKNLHSNQEYNQKFQVSRMTIYDCLDEFQSTDIMDFDNRWDCPKCKEKRKALKRISIYKAPEVLILFFKRFQSTGQDDSHEMRKLQNFVSFPQLINLQGYVEKQELPYTAKKKPLKYHLFAVANHFNITSNYGQSGHYTAYVLKNDGWYYVNDEKVGQIKEKDVNSKNAYMLFYSRIQR